MEICFSLYLDSKTVRDLFSAHVWQASYCDPIYTHWFSGQHCPPSFSPAHLSPLLLWCLCSRQPSPSLPPAFILRSRRRQTLLASIKQTQGCCDHLHSPALHLLGYEFISWSQVARAVYGAPDDRSPKPYQLLCLELASYVPGLYLLNNLCCLLHFFPLS